MTRPRPCTGSDGEHRSSDVVVDPLRQDTCAGTGCIGAAVSVSISRAPMSMTRCCCWRSVVKHLFGAAALRLPCLRSYLNRYKMRTWPKKKNRSNG